MNKIFIEELEKEALKMLTSVKRKVDFIKEGIKFITYFFDHLNKSFVSFVENLSANIIPSSTDMNNFFTAIEKDINLIHKIQQSIRDSITVHWNATQQLITKVEESIYDDKIVLEYPKALVSNQILLGIKTYTDVLDKVKDKPVLEALSTNSDIKPFYGKEYGVFIDGFEMSEDGIRYNSDNNVIIDGQDTFFEAEATILESETDDVIHVQSVTTNTDLNLIVNCKILFKEETEINSITIIPHNFSADKYYKLTKLSILGKSKSTSYNLDSIITKETNITFTRQKAMSVYMTFLQPEGYYEKYSLVKVKFGEDEYWIDATGKHILEKAKKIGINSSEAIKNVILNVKSWISVLTNRNINFTKVPEIVKSAGQNGFKIVSSQESKRKRWAIGIEDIKIGLNVYENESEIITNPILIPENTNSVSLSMISVGNIESFFSFDNGLTWNQILSLSKNDVILENLKKIPKKIYIKSDMSNDQKLQSETGMEGFTNITDGYMRIKFVLKKESTIIDSPYINEWRLIFD